MKRPKPITLSIPQPCHEDWNKMTQQEQGRFCAACNKCVVDFTGWSDGEIYKYLHGNTGAVCGRFKMVQLNRNIVIHQAKEHRPAKWLLGVGLSLLFTPLPQIVTGQTRDTSQQKIHIVNNKDPKHSLKDTTAAFKGVVIDGVSREPLIGCIVELFKDGRSRGGSVADIDGAFSIKPIPPGVYNLRIRLRSYQEITGAVTIEAGKVHQAEYIMTPDTSFKEEVITGYVVGLIKKDEPGEITTGEAQIPTHGKSSSTKSSFFQRLFRRKK